MVYIILLAGAPGYYFFLSPEVLLGLGGLLIAFTGLLGTIFIFIIQLKGQQTKLHDLVNSTATTLNKVIADKAFIEGEKSGQEKERANPLIPATETKGNRT